MELSKVIEKLEALRRTNGGNIEVLIVDDFLEDQTNLYIEEGTDCMGSNVIELGFLKSV